MLKYMLIPLCCVVAMLPALACATTPSATEIVRKVQDLLRSDSSYARYTMVITTPDWQRELRFDSWDDRQHKRFFVRILAPRKDKNTTWLKDGSKLWMYIPRLERDLRIPPSMMLSSWMGSDFTNDDLVKMESVVEDYEHTLVADQDGVMVIESIPHPDAAVVWGKLVHRINHDFIPLSVDYYNEHGQLVRTMRYRDVREMDGRRIPVVWSIEPLSEPGKKTTLTLETVDFDVPLSASMFTRRHLREAR